MDILPFILFLLGVVFLVLGWRWQSPPSEEAITALKGLTYLKKEILRVQDQIQVHVLEDKIQRTNQLELMEVEHKETGDKGKNKLYVLNAKDQRESSRGVEITSLSEEPLMRGIDFKPQLQRNISPKYQEVLELAAHGQRIPEIAQRLFLSQDAVMMVLQTQSKGGT